MRNITICSKIYKQEIIDFYYNDIKEHIAKEGEKNNEYFFTFRKEFLDYELLAHLMEDIILESDPVVRESNRLCHIIKSLVFKNDHENIKEELKKYFKQNQILNIEGYLHFRMYSYADKISSILYSVVKNNLCIE